MHTKVDGGKRKTSADAIAPTVPPGRPRNDVLDDIAARLAALEATIGELRSPAAEEVLVDFVTLIRVRLQPLREGTEKAPRTKMGGYKPFTDGEPDDSTCDGEAADAAADDAFDVGF